MTQVTLLILIFTWFGSATVSTQPQTCPGAQHPVTHIGERVPSNLKLRIGETHQELMHPNSRYLRARIEVGNAGTCDWLLTVRDADFHVIQTFNREDFRTTLNRWTNRVPAVARKQGNSNTMVSQIIFTLKPCSQGSTPEIRFPEYVTMPTNAKSPYYSSQTAGQPTYKPLYQFRESENPVVNKPLGDVVGFVMTSWGRLSWTCTGVFVAENLIMTNWHCGGPGTFVQDGTTVNFPENGYWNPQIVKDTIVDLSFDDDGLSQEYTVTRVAASDPDLDFAILEVVPVDAGRRVRPALINPAAVINGTPLKVVHHPAAEQKMITVGVGCRVESINQASWRLGVENVDFTHKCDTEKGSSGAPVFNAANELIGLHHRGFKVNQATCQEEDKLNKAVKIEKIFEFVRSCNKDVAPRLSLTSSPGPELPCPRPTPTP